VLMPDGSAGRGLRHALGDVARRGLTVLPRLRHTLTALGLSAVALLLWQHDRIWEAELSSLSPVPASQLALDEALRNDLSAGDSGALVVIQAPDAQTALERAEAAGSRLDALVADGRLRGYDSVTRLLPSLATQDRRRAALPDADTLRRSLAEATAGGPLPASRLEPFIADVQAARTGPPITPESAREGPARALVDALLIRARSGGWMALIALHAAGDSVDVAATDRALGDLPDVHVVQIGEELRGLYRHYLREAQTQALAGGAAVLLLMALWLRSPRRLLGVCVPLVLAVALVMGGLRLAQVPLGILHLVGLLLVVAVGSNYALFFDLLHEQGAVDDDTLASLLLANGTTVLSFGLIALSSIPALSAIGVVVAPGALLALLASAAYARSGRRPPGAAV
jgi:predicted exporter